MTPIEGVDYAFPPIPSPSALALAGKRFACRYGGPGSASKQLTASELASLRRAGIDVVANAEGVAGAFTSAEVGRRWAQSAKEYFDALGMPAGRPIYFSVDFDAAASDMAGIDAALRAAAGVIGAARVGVYGSYNVIAHCSAAGTAHWFWQTYAWSGGRWHAACHMQQYRNEVMIGGVRVDLTRAMKPDFGQWGYEGESMELTSANIRDIAQGIASKLYVDLKTPSSGIASVLAANQAASEQRIIKAVTSAMTKALDLNAFVDALIAKLPGITDPVSQEEVTTAVREAFSEAFGQTTEPGK